VTEAFFLRALAAALGVALVAAPLGCFVVWRRMAYFGATLAHSALLGIALGILLGVNPSLGIAASAIAIALIVTVFERQRLIGRDTLLGILAHAGLAIGLVALSFIEGPRIDLMGYLFGDVLAVTRRDLVWIGGGGLATLAALAALWRPLLAVTLNEELARAEGVAVVPVQLGFMLTLAITIAIAMKVVGILLDHPRRHRAALRPHAGTNGRGRGGRRRPRRPRRPHGLAPMGYARGAVHRGGRNGAVRGGLGGGGGYEGTGWVRPAHCGPPIDRSNGWTGRHGRERPPTLAAGDQARHALRRGQNDRPGHAILGGQQLDERAAGDADGHWNFAIRLLELGQQAVARAAGHRRALAESRVGPERQDAGGQQSQGHANHGTEENPAHHGGHDILLGIHRFGSPRQERIFLVLTLNLGTTHRDPCDHRHGSRGCDGDAIGREAVADRLARAAESPGPQDLGKPSL
jgi:zinc transport system permease protein